jgi:hypothetical protein
MDSKLITLASFVYEDKIEGFKKYLYKRFNIKENKIFQYSFDELDKKILTFMVKVNQGERIETNSFFPPTVIVHKKGECFYTINALNRLIELTSETDLGNLNYTEVKIDWDNYQNKIIIVRGDELKIFTINKDF